MSKRIAIFTHYDLDGIFASFLLEQYFQRQDQATLCQVKSGSAGKRGRECVNRKLTNQGLWCYDQIILTDFVPTRQNCQRLLAWQNAHQENVLIFDHHAQSSKLACKFPDLQFVLAPSGNEFVSASLLVLNWIKTKDSILYRKYVDFANCVNAYDTYAFSLLPDHPYQDVAIKWNMLFYHLGIEKFLKRIQTNPDPKYLTSNELRYCNDQDELIKNNLELVTMQRQEYLVKLTKHKAIKVWLTNFLPKYASEISNIILTEHSDLDIIILSNSAQAIFRTRKDDLDMNRLAHLFNGGGHQKAAGAKISWLELERYFETQTSRK